MKKILYALILAAILSQPALAMGRTSDQLGIYTALRAGYSHQHIRQPKAYINGVHLNTATSRSDDVAGVFFAAGYDFSRHYGKIPVRIELEYSIYEKFKTDGAKIRFDTLFINTYYDFINETKFVPFVMLGLGASFSDFNISNPAFTKSDSATALSFSTGAGISYNITPCVSVDFAYRFSDYGKTVFRRYVGEDALLKVSGRTTASQLLLGLRYNF